MVVVPQEHNGSGKTTTIRMALGIIRPDEGLDGSVSILGWPPGRNVLKGVGYLPEERGLPREIPGAARTALPRPPQGADLN